MLADSDKRSLRVCITIRPEVNDKILALQSKTLKKTGKNYPFSKAVSDILEEHFK